MTTLLLGLYIALIFIRPMEWWDPVKGLPLVNFTAIGTLLMTMPRLLNQFQLIWRLVPEVRMCFFLLAAATLSHATSFYLSGAINAFQTFGKIVILYILVVFLGRNMKAFRFLLWVVFLSVAWLAVHGIVQHDTGYGFGGKQAFYRGKGVYQIIAYGIFEDPNDLCLAFIIALPLLYVEFRAAANPLVKTVALALIPLVGYGAWLTNSRGGIVGIFGMISAYAIGRMQGFRRWLSIAVGVLTVTVLLPSRGSQLGMIDRDRVVSWGDGIGGWKSAPLFGIGYGNFGELTYKERAAHNSYVNALAELGIAGYAPFMILLCATLIHVRRASLRKDIVPRVNQLYLGGLFSALCGYLTSAYFLTRTYNPVLYILLALATCQVIISLPTHESYSELVLQPWRKDRKFCIQMVFATILGLYLSIRIAYMLGAPSGD